MKQVDFAFKNVVCVHEPFTGQTFLVNYPLAVSLIYDLMDGVTQAWTTFVNIATSPPVVSKLKAVFSDSPALR